MFTLTLTEEQVEVVLNSLTNYHKSGDALTIQTITNQLDSQKATLTTDAIETAQEVLAQVQEDTPTPKKTKKSK